MKLIKVFFKKIFAREGDDYWYAYSNTPSFSATASMNGTTATFNVSIRKNGVSTTPSSSDDEQITMWLSGLTDEEALLYRDTFGSVAYLQVDADGNSTLVSEQDFQNLPADDQANLTTSLHTSAQLVPTSVGFVSNKGALCVVCVVIRIAHTYTININKRHLNR